jgi:uncharacterized protein YaiE (UPF0345 family)
MASYSDFTESDRRKKVKPGEPFEVSARSKFTGRVAFLTDYCCSSINRAS